MHGPLTRKSICSIIVVLTYILEDEKAFSIKMTMNQLPQPLQVTLDTLLTDNQLSSWQVKGGHQYIQVSIRFSTAAIHANITDVKYRRAPPSRINRDNIRAREHQNNVAIGLSETGLMDVIHKTNDTHDCALEEDANDTKHTEEESSSVLPSRVGVVEHSPCKTTSRV